VAYNHTSQNMCTAAQQLSPARFKVGDALQSISSVPRSKDEPVLRMSLEGLNLDATFDALAAFADVEDVVVSVRRAVRVDLSQVRF
jgi:hypothetical protein